MKQVEQEQGQETFPALQLVLPQHGLLKAQHSTRSLFYFSASQHTPPTLVIHQQFSPSEWRVLLPLMRCFPSALLYETLLAALHKIKLTESRELIQQAGRDGARGAILRPLRDTVSRLRPKVQPFSFDIATRSGMGYAIIVPHTGSNHRKQGW